MGGASSKLEQRAMQSLTSIDSFSFLIIELKTKVDSLPSEGISPQELDRILENGHFQPKTEWLLKDAYGIGICNFVLIRTSGKVEE